MALHYVEYLLKECPLTLIYAVVFLLLSFLYFKLKNSNLPPGPWGLPFVGYWPYIKSQDFHLQFEELMKKYGEIYTLNVAGQLYVHLGSVKSIKEAHVTKSDCFVGRTTAFNTVFYFFDEGVFSANGDAWKLLRKFFVQSFREYGLTSGKDVSGSIQDSVSSAIEHLRSASGAPVDIIPVITLHCSTILRRMLFNDDGVTAEELMEINEMYDKVIDVFLDKRILLAGKLAKYVILPFDPRFKDSIKTYKRIEAILNNIMKRHHDTLDERNIRNVIDSYYKERNERKKRGDPAAKYFTDKALLSTLLQFIGDGALGVAIYISHCLQALLQYPDEQEKIFEELDNVIGPDRQPSLEDKNNLPYTTAFVFEATRTTKFASAFPALECTTETTLGGYRIPKGTITLMNSWAAHRDPNVYDDPDKFKPARFLKEYERGKTELPLLFGVGKRSCIGESYTTLQAFLFIAILVKNFRLEIPERAPSYPLEGKMEIILHPRKNK